MDSCGASPDVRDALFRTKTLCFKLVFRAKSDVYVENKPLLAGKSSRKGFSSNVFRRIEASPAILSSLVFDFASATQPPALLLQLLERGSPALGTPLGLQAHRLAHSFAESGPSHRGTLLLAAYRLCALHPPLLQAVAAEPDAIAVGLSRCLATSQGPLVTAAAELVEDFAELFAGLEPLT